MYEYKSILEDLFGPCDPRFVFGSIHRARNGNDVPRTYFPNGYHTHGGCIVDIRISHVPWNHYRYAQGAWQDETYVGGKEKNKHDSKKTKAGWGTGGKTAIVGMKDRKTSVVQAQVIKNTARPTLSGLVAAHTVPGAEVYTDGHSGYDWVPNREVVCHSAKKYVNGMAHTNGIELFWSMLKRGYVGTYHKEFSGRHNARPLDTIVQMEQIAQGLVGKNLKYRDLVA